MMKLPEAFLVYGTPFKSNKQFPWHHENFQYDINAWWRMLNGCINPHANMWRSIKLQRELQQQYYQYQSIWDEDNGCPIQILINSVAASYDSYMLYTQKSTACQVGETRYIDTMESFVTPNDETLIENFVKAHGIEPEASIGWYLCCVKY